jgi:hypothetical protein
MPIATIHQGVFRLAKKNASLSVLLRPAKNEISINNEKYESNINKMVSGDIFSFNDGCKSTKICAKLFNGVLT